MANKTATTGIIAFLTGLTLGALGTFAAKKKESTLNFMFLGDEPTETGSCCGGQCGVPPTCGGDEPEFENITPDTSTLIDSLQGIEVPGDVATLLKVRVLGVERAKAVAMWGTKGINHDEPCKFKRLADLTTEHLLNIKNNSRVATPDEITIIDSILEDRVASGEADASVLE